MSDLRSKVIRIAAAMPKGSAGRKALLDVLANRMKKVRVRVPRNTRVQGYGVFYAGDYLVEMPVDYDEDEVTPEDIIHDGEITVIKEDY